jgi:hypothetical protein
MMMYQPSVVDVVAIDFMIINIDLDNDDVFILAPCFE